MSVAACFVCFERGSVGAGRAGERGWAAAVVIRGRQVIATATIAGAAGAPYEAGLLALREAPLLAAAVDALAHRPDVLMVDATGRDHPRRAGMALHLGAVLDLPTVGVTNRTLVARGEPPPDERLASSPLLLDGDEVGRWVRTRPRRHPVAVHAAWRTAPAVAAAVVATAVERFRTPEPLRLARHHARQARHQRPDDEG